VGNPFTTAGWSMGYTPSLETAAPIRSINDGDFEVPGNDRSWWDAQLDTSISAGLGDLRWHLSDVEGVRYWGVDGVCAGRSVSIRVPRLLEHRDGEPIADEVMVVVESRLTLPRLGSWVIESPTKWFRGRRAWALNRPKFGTEDPWFDEHAGCWAWDCGDGPQALREALAPVLPVIREALDAHPGVIITDTAISTWIPYTEIPDRLPEFLSAVRSP
jgi:hypothetical protein